MKNRYDNKICSTCETAYSSTSSLDICVTCLDERQWVPQEGQLWTKLSDLQKNYSVKLNLLSGQAL